MAQRKKGNFVFYRGAFYGFLTLLFGITLARGIFAAEVRSLVIASIGLVFLLCVTLFKRKWKALLVLLAFFFAGQGLYFAGMAFWGGNDYQGSVVVVGRVDDQLYDYEEMQVAILKDVTINGKSEKNLYLTIFNYDGEKVKNGDIVTFSASVKSEKLFEYGKFDTYTFRNGIGYSATASRENVVAIDSKLKADEKYRLYAKSLLEKGMGKEQASISYAVLFGDKTEVPSDVKLAYRDAGIIHILTVSGLHVGFLIAFIMFIFKKCKLNRYVSFALMAIFLILYSWLCGFSPSVVRASVMGIVIMLSRLGSRRYDSLSSLGVAGLIILIFSPLSALDVGFLMSFFSVGTIFFAFPAVARLLVKFLPRKAAEMISLTICAQLGIVPFLSIFSESFNILSIIANFVILPIFTITFPALFVCNVIISIMPFLAPCYIVFKYIFLFMTMVAKFFALSSLRVPLSELKLEVVICFYVIIFAISDYFLVKRLVKGAVVAGGLFMLVLVSVLNLIPTKVASIDVVTLNGSSQSIVLTSDTGQRLVVGDIGKTYWNKYSNRTQVRGFDFYVSDGAASSSDLEFISKQNCQSVLVCDTLESPKEGVIEGKNNFVYHLGNFSVCYVETENVFIGIEISYFSHTIFFATSSKLSYNKAEIAKSYLATKRYDLAVLGVNDALSQSFHDAFVVSQSGEEGLSYAHDGNLRLKFLNEKWLAKCLD